MSCADAAVVCLATPPTSPLQSPAPPPPVAEQGVGLGMGWGGWHSAPACCLAGALRKLCHTRRIVRRHLDSPGLRCTVPAGAPPSTGTAELLRFPNLCCSSLDREPSSSASHACTAPSSTGNGCIPGLSCSLLGTNAPSSASPGLIYSSLDKESSSTSASLICSSLDKESRSASSASSAPCRYMKTPFLETFAARPHGPTTPPSSAGDLHRVAPTLVVYDVQLFQLLCSAKLAVEKGLA
ncbi:hypothetical protein Taro_051575 [Colocasia esculenta]|uniref:Uncharacterized protein n=1 Tax=Colocasia esculenta TaxID=4460 RepID=A0A843XHA2_COLES|nr:hypothetical protein [Colocasia esculenta]